METNRKRSRGFLKGKLAPFYRAPKPSEYSTTTNVKPNHASPSPVSVGYVLHQHQETQRSPKVIVVSDKCHSSYYGLPPPDEGVDAKAELYISMVQQRFMLERLNAEALQEK